MQSEKHPKISQALQRYRALYPRLVKQKVKESGYGEKLAELQASANLSSRQNTEQFFMKQLNTAQRVQLIYTIAKGEVDSLIEHDNDFWQALLLEIDNFLGQSEPAVLPDEQLFVCCLLMRLALKSGQRAEITTMLLNLITRAQGYITRQLEKIDQSESAEEAEPCLAEDSHLQAQMDFIVFILRKGVVKHEIAQAASGNCDQLEVIFGEATKKMAEFLKIQEGIKYVKLKQFAPYAIWYEVLFDIFWKLKQQKVKVATLFRKDDALKSLLKVTFDVLHMYRQNSQYYMVNVGSVMNKKNDSQTGEQTTSVKEVRRQSKLFSEILDLLVSFLSSYLNSLPDQEQAETIRIFEILLKNAHDSAFTLMERLLILNELNFLFQKVNQIYTDPVYWSTMREGLADFDQATRKLALNVLKSNLKSYGAPENFTKAEFELFWTTFFDIYDTLESFGAHYTKNIWHRTDLFYDHIRRLDSQYQKCSLVPLEDARMWLLVIYHRVSTHTNLSIRKYVQRQILDRDFVTIHMREFIFNELVAWLNQCLLFKDVNNFVQFSKNAPRVLKFYDRFFKNESQNLKEDLRSFYMGFQRNKSQSQMTLISLRVLQNDYVGPSSENLEWIGSSEIGTLYNMIDVAFMDQVLSSRYLCYKYINRMMANHLKPSALTDYSILFKLIGLMPLEFFSNKTVLDDSKARESTLKLISCFQEQLQQQICEYLNTLFTVKAMAIQMPKFGRDSDLIVQGITRLTMIAGNVQWLTSTMDASVEAIDAALQSTYLQAQLVEEKVKFFVQVCIQLYSYGTDAMRSMVYKLLTERAGALLSRFWDQLCDPLTRDDDLLASEHDKIESTFANIDTYGQLVALTIKIIHLQDGRQFNALETFTKNVLTRAVQVTGQSKQVKAPWSAYLLQYSILEILQAILNAYAVGIKQSLQQQKSQVFIQDELFTIGKVVLQNLLTFEIRTKPNGDTPLNQDQEHFMIRLDQSIGKMNQHCSFNKWRCLTNLVNLFQFDPDLKSELLLSQNKQISKQTLEFLDACTPNYNPHIFQVLRLTFVPQIQMTIGTNAFVDLIEDYQFAIRQCWSIIKEQKCDVQAEELLEFLEFAFNPEILEQFQSLNPDDFDRVTKFHNKLCKEMLEYAQKYWLILRAFFNHLMFMFAERPHLMRGFEQFMIGFGTVRECRALDAEIKLWKLQVMIPQIIPKKYENLPLEEVTFGGAYIRSMTLIILEGIIKNYLQAIQDGRSSKHLEWTKEALVAIVVHLIVNSEVKRGKEKADMPFTDAHRYKLRTWQMILVLTPMLIDKNAQPSAKTLETVEKALWPILKASHIQNVRQYIECFAIKFIVRFPELTLRPESHFYQVCLQTRTHKPQYSSSLLMIAGYVLLHIDPETCTGFKRQIFDQLVGFAGSNSAHCRSIAHYFIMKLSENEPALIGSALKPLMTYLNEAKDVQRMKEKYQEMLDTLLYKCLALEGASQVLTYDLTVEGEFIGKAFVDELNKVTADVMGQFRHCEEVPYEKKDWWKKDLEERKESPDFNVTVTEESSNYQRKILPWNHVEFDTALQKRVFFQRRRNEIIMCASLIDKIPNLAGLARTSEIMNASSLVINQAAVCQTDEFKGISVTSEKWLPIYEVKERDLLDYLSYQKSNGYKIVGIEQTADSKMLHTFQFPTRCILLLGKEKEGIPQEYYSIMDFCVEIPQFGIIRSLNVHVTGALCLWEYTKQHMPPLPPSAQTNQQ